MARNDQQGVEPGEGEAPAGETKAEKFIRVGQLRTGKALHALGTLVACTDKKAYDYTPEQAEKIVDALKQQVMELEEAFAAGGPPTRATGFTL